MTLHILTMPRPGHTFETNDGDAITRHFFDGAKIANPVEQDKLEPSSENSYFRKARGRLQAIYEEEPELFEDGLVILYATGLTPAVLGARDATIAEGLECLVGIWDRDDECYNMQAQGVILRNEKSIAEKIYDARPVVPLSSLRCTTE